METNTPALWKHLLPIPASNGHKYDRGHALILGAFELVGATHMAAAACSRIGAGLTTVIAPKKTDLYQIVLPPDIMVRKMVAREIKKVTAVLAGPGGASAGQSKDAIHNSYDAPCILDANAIPVFSVGVYPLANKRTILTPHDGEFAKTFPRIGGTRQEKAVGAAKMTNAVVVLKGSQTVIASPDGRCILNDHASPWLAKAGTGDVLAGMITGLVAQQMPLFEACAASCWIHGEAGRRIGPGLIASDIEKILSQILTEFTD